MKKPIIGITTDYDLRKGREHSFVYAAYHDAIARAGGLPVLVPPLDAQADMAFLLTRIDGVLFTGGDDLHPRHYSRESVHPAATLQHPRRESFELALARAVMPGPLPVLGICAGMQLFNVAAGGDLHQDIPRETPGAVRHSGDDRPNHPVDVVAGSLLERCIGGETGRVNSVHHQAVRRLGADLVASAHAPDGVVEALERPGNPFFLAVQWHPEIMDADPRQERLFRCFVEHAAHRTKEGGGSL